ncbi:type VI secretion system baseplate subunit TssK [Paracraurococcus lichenis]|uniref:Type VI secretion system baseplate subunit TssK n=1 Tax=Paracraurococcus lichenis TaxID=3064888 RepID=A0ABT9DY00_9PROT|nr:type VI secretion system baseplate subunit TssK [Paracraurococcus sp. LOR1-02]MDO9708754.1 type VI secretion system baseplate subunit TssK [Paracraurococcus sp. LOR1-02]
MSWSSRVIWQEGMFLRAQHFQQQDRWTEALLRAVALPLRPYPWGLVAWEPEEGLLRSGRFALASAAGLFEDGTPFAFPAEAEHPPPLELGESAAGQVVHLALPILQAGNAEVAAPGHDGRYAVEDFDAADTQSLAREQGRLAVGRLRLRYLLGSEDRTGHHCIGLARVREVTPDRRVVLDPQWIPPALTCLAAPVLKAFVAELFGMLGQRGEELGGRLAQPGTRGAAEVQDVLLLQAVNRWQGLLAHWAEAPLIHPETLYATLVQMVAELSTFTDRRRPRDYPPYRHEDLQISFTPVIADLRQALSRVQPRNAVPVPLQERGYGIRVGLITDRSLLRGSVFVLTAQASMPDETLRRLLPRHLRIGAVENIHTLVNTQLPGIEVRPLPAAPRQLPFYDGATYFELNPRDPLWSSLQNASGIAAHINRDFPDLRLELWAIRN